MVEIDNRKNMRTLLETIEQGVEHKKTKDQMYHELLGQGHTLQAIDAAWKDVHARRSPFMGMSMMAVLGAVLVGVGVLSFVASNWDAMNNATRILIILAAMVGSYAAGWMLLQRGKKVTGRALILLGSIIYGAGIMLVGQMYHVQTNWMNAFNLWLIGVLAITTLFLSLSHGVLACVLFFVSNMAFAFEMIGRGINSEIHTVITDGSWVTISIMALSAAAFGWTAWHMRRAMNSKKHTETKVSSSAKKWLGRIVQLFVVAAVSQGSVAMMHALDMVGVADITTVRVVGGFTVLLFFWAAYEVRGRLVLFFAIVNLMSWWSTAVISPERAAHTVSAHGFVGLLLLLFVALIVFGAGHRLLSKYRHFEGVYVGPALTFVLILLTVISSSNAIMELWDGYGENASILASWSVTFTYFLLIAIVAGLLFVLTRLRGGLSRIELIWLAVLGVVSLVVGTLAIAAVDPETMGRFVSNDTSKFTVHGIVWALVLNVIAFATMIWVAIVGYQRHDRWRVTTAAVAICIWVLARYFDWIFTYLDKSVGFITLGAILLGVGYGLERSRKKIIASFTNHHSA
jgi:uncharacterized membrane protein